MDEQFTATLRKSPSKGGWTYVVWPDSVRFLRHPGAGQGARNHRRPPLPEPFMALGDGTHNCR